MGNEQTHTTEETVLGEKTQQEVNTNLNAEQTQSGLRPPAHEARGRG